MQFKTIILLQIVALQFFALVSTDCQAENRWIAGTRSSKLSQILADSRRDRVYVADLAAKQLIVIDSNQEVIVKRISLPEAPIDMALKKSMTEIAIAGPRSLTLINTLSFRATTYSLFPPITGQLASVTYGNSSQLFLATIHEDSPYDNWGSVHEVSPHGKSLRLIKSFKGGHNLVFGAYQALLRTDAKGRYLYVAERGISPGAVYKIDVRNPITPISIGESTFGEIGSIEDFVVSPSVPELYLSGGSSTGIQILNSQTLRSQGSLTTGGYTAAVGLDSHGTRLVATNKFADNLFSLNSPGAVYFFNPVGGNLVSTLPLQTYVPRGKPLARGASVERHGLKAFIIHGDDYPTTADMMIEVTDLPPAE